VSERRTDRSRPRQRVDSCAGRTLHGRNGPAALRADAAEHEEAYSDVKFTLITDKEAKGAFIARPGRMDGPLKLAPDQQINPEKNKEGMWEAHVVLEP